MLLITIVLILIGIIAYAIIGNIIVHFLDDYHWIDITPDVDIEFVYFALGLFFPFLVFYILVREISIYIYNVITDRYE